VWLSQDLLIHFFMSLKQLHSWYELVNLVSYSVANIAKFGFDLHCNCRWSKNTYTYPYIIMQRVSFVAKGLRSNRYLSSNAVRNDWTKKEIQDIYDTPLMDLVFRFLSLSKFDHIYIYWYMYIYIPVYTCIYIY
jgi:hypothetical protein